MPIPNNINKGHILEAINKVDRDGVPEDRKLRKWGVKFNKKIYPCKLLISWGNIYANGIELDPNPNNFQTNMAQDFLKNLGFEIVRLTK
jgi:hypothetical protein